MNTVIKSRRDSNSDHSDAHYFAAQSKDSVEDAIKSFQRVLVKRNAFRYGPTEVLSAILTARFGVGSLGVNSQNPFLVWARRQLTDPSSRRAHTTCSEHRKDLK